jgi:hypothetical protein
MSLGPVEYVVIEFPGNRFSGEIAPALAELVQNGDIRIIDLLFIKKDADGGVEWFEIDDLDDVERGPFGDLERDENDLVSEEDVALVAQALEPNSSAGLLIWENRWAAGFAQAVRNANGRVVERQQIPFEIVEAAFQAQAAS